MNDQNLIPFDKRTESEQREIRSKGGKASVKKRRVLKTFRELLEVSLSVESTNKATGEVRTLKDIGMLALANKVKAGDLKAIKLAAELLGEMNHTVNAEGISINISTSKEGKSNIEKLMEE